MKSFIITVALICTFGNAHGQAINDPIKDFLTLPIEDRYTDASEIVEIHKVNIDLDLDGKPELLIGHHKMWLGDNENIYFAIYRELPSGGHKRLTEPDEDIALTLRDGRPEYNYVGRVNELGATGLLICNPPQGDAEMRAARVESRVFVSITGDAVRARELPGLDLTKEADQAFYRKYFPLPGQQGGYQAVSLKPDDLKALGLVLPNWTKPVRMGSSETAVNETTLNATSPGLTQPPKSKSATGSKPAQGEKPASSTPWIIIVVLMVAALGLPWLLLQRRK